MAEFVKEGEKVEVMSQEQGFENSYYTARVTQIRGGMCRVKYQTLKNDAGKNLTEDVPLGWVRPYPEVHWRYPDFVPEDVVDAWDHDGWWKGEVVEKTRSGSYIVRFEHPTRHGNHELTLSKTQLRVHTEWNPAGPEHWTYVRPNWPPSSPFLPDE